jgi:esterase/lipase
MFLGPRQKYPTFDARIPELGLDINDLEEYIHTKESHTKGLKPDNEARIIWADSNRTRTEYAVVYLHGYSASPMEGDGVHLPFAKRYGFNLYLARLAGHGTEEDEPMLHTTSKEWVESAKEALAIGQQLGEKVILMSTSTGATLGTYLAAENPDIVHAHIMYSPNFGLVHKSAKILLWPWGMQIARLINGGKYRKSNFETDEHQYWTVRQRLEGIAALQHLIKHTCKDELFKKINSPYFIGYYYKNEQEKDGAVSIERMKDFHRLASTPDEQKRFVAFPSVADHCMVSTLRSKDLPSVRAKTYQYAEEVLGLSPKG